MFPDVGDAVDVGGVDVGGVDVDGVIPHAHPSAFSFSITFFVQSASGLGQIMFPDTVCNLQMSVGY